MKARCIDHRLPVARPLLIYKSDSGGNKLSTSPPFHRVSERQGSKEAVGSVAKTVSVSQNKTKQNKSKRDGANFSSSPSHLVPREVGWEGRGPQRERERETTSTTAVGEGCLRQFLCSLPGSRSRPEEAGALPPQKCAQKDIQICVGVWVYTTLCPVAARHWLEVVRCFLCGGEWSVYFIIIIMLQVTLPLPPFTRGCYPLGGLVGGFVCVCNRVKGRVREASAGFCWCRLGVEWRCVILGVDADVSGLPRVVTGFRGRLHVHVRLRVCAGLEKVGLHIVVSGALMWFN